MPRPSPISEKRRAEFMFAASRAMRSEMRRATPLPIDQCKSVLLRIQCPWQEPRKQEEAGLYLRNRLMLILLIAARMPDWRRPAVDFQGLEAALMHAIGALQDYEPLPDDALTALQMKIFETLVALQPARELQQQAEQALNGGYRVAFAIGLASLWRDWFGILPSVSGRPDKARTNFDAFCDAIVQSINSLLKVEIPDENLLTRHVIERAVKYLRSGGAFPWNMVPKASRFMNDAQR